MERFQTDSNDLLLVYEQGETALVSSFQSFQSAQHIQVNEIKGERDLVFEIEDLDEIVFVFVFVSDKRFTMW